MSSEKIALLQDQLSWFAPPLSDDYETLRKQASSMALLIDSLRRQMIALYSKQDQHNEAIRTLDSEREANETLTNELAKFTKYHDLMEDAVKTANIQSEIWYHPERFNLEGASLPRDILEGIVDHFIELHYQHSPTADKSTAHYPIQIEVHSDSE